MKKICAFLVIFCCASFAFSQNARTITVVGSGSVKVSADMASLSFSVITKEKTALESVQLNAKKMNAVFDALKQIEISDGKVSTSNYSLYQESIYRDGKNEPGLYVVSNNIIVVLDDVEKSGKVIDTVIASGANRMNGISFSAKDTKAALDEARILAVAQAKEKAELFAREAGCKLGKVLSITENSGNYATTRVMMATKEMASNSTTISTGDENIDVSVTIVYELK